MNTPKVLLVVSLFMMAGADSFGRVPDVRPDAGSIIRQQLPERDQQDAATLKGESRERGVVESASLYRVTVKGFVFDGYSGIASEAELQRIVEGSVGKTLDVEELTALMRKVTAYLRSEGWFVSRAYLPEQDLAAGIVRVEILQGRSDGEITIRRDKTVRIHSSNLREIAKTGAQMDQPLSLRRLERSLVLENDLPGVVVKASIAPGSTSGSSKVFYDVSEGSLVAGAAWIDNYGNRYTGSLRGNAMVNLNDPLGYGDQLTLFYSGASGLNQGKIMYAFPLNASGLRGYLSWSGMNYVLKEDFASLDYTGKSYVTEGGMTYPLIRNRKTTVNIGVNYVEKLLIDRQLGQTLHDKTVKIGNVSVSALNYDNLMGGGSTSAKIGLNLGKFKESIPIAVIDEQIMGVKSNFNTLAASVSRIQRVGAGMTMNLAWSAQFASSNLDTSEKFYLGGPEGIRAYPIGEAPGDSGHLLNADYRCKLPMPEGWGTWQVGGFFDAGHVTLNTNRYRGDVTNATGSNAYWLQGAGVNLTWNYGKTCVLRTTWAHTIGENAGRSVQGNNCDGKSDKGRFWFQGMLYF